MNIKHIRTAKDHEQAIERLKELWGVDKSTPEGEEFEMLFDEVEKYEDKLMLHDLEELEDAALLKAMEKANTNERVSREEVFKVLGKRKGKS